MALINRLSRLFQADMNAVLDQVEEPQILLRQSIREMEENLEQQETQIRLAEYEQQQLTKKEQHIKQLLTELDNQLLICFESDKDELAHGLVRQKLEINQNLKIIIEDNANSVEHSQQLSTKLRENQAQLNSMKQKAEIFNPDRTSSSFYSAWDNHHISISDEQVEVAFLQARKNWSQS